MVRPSSKCLISTYVTKCYDKDQNQGMQKDSIQEGLSTHVVVVRKGSWEILHLSWDLKDEQEIVV